MDETHATLSALQARACAAEAAAEQLQHEKAELKLANEHLSRELEALQSRLEFAEALVGPTETQRRLFQDQLTAARDAILQVAHGCPKSLSTRCLGRLDGSLIRSKGLTDAEGAMLQNGRVSGEGGVPCEVSLLGDPAFSPYDRETLQPNWQAKGGFLQMSLGDVREKWGEDVALEVVRCAVELDKYDASRRLGVELPWNEKENREMEISEVICLLGQQLADRRSSQGSPHFAHETEDGESDWASSTHSDLPGPEEWNGGSQAWSMLEAMINDLGVDQTTLPGTTEHISHQLSKDDETDETLVAEALEERSQSDAQEEAAAEQDIQNMLLEPQVIPPSLSLLQPPASQQKAATSRWLTPSGAQTPCSSRSPVAVTRNIRAPISQSPAACSPGGTLVCSSGGCEADPPAMPPEASNNDTLLLQILQDDVGGNLSYLLARSESAPPCPPPTI